MEQLEIKGRIVWQDLESGFWGIIDEDGRQWRPNSLPAAFQRDGAEVRVKAERSEEGFSMFMWGSPITILDIQ